MDLGGCDPIGVELVDSTPRRRLLFRVLSSGVSGDDESSALLSKPAAAAKSIRYAPSDPSSSVSNASLPPPSQRRRALSLTADLLGGCLTKCVKQRGIKTTCCANVDWRMPGVVCNRR